MVFGPTMALKLLCIIRLAPYPNRSSSTDFVDEPINLMHMQRSARIINQIFEYP